MSDENKPNNQMPNKMGVDEADPPEINTKDVTKKRWVNRRTVLKLLAASAGTLAIGAAIGGPTLVREGRLAANQAFLSGGPPMPTVPEEPFIWFRLEPDNTVHLYIPKVEMGQGIHTALAQIAADELEVLWEQIVVHQADTTKGFAAFTTFTFGSASVTSLYQPIREIAATLRNMLQTEGASQLGVTTEAVIAEEGAVFIKTDPAQRRSYGKIVAARQTDWVLPETMPSLKSPEQFRYIGRSMARVELREKVTGRAVYGYDARLPGMLYGAVARPPRYGAILTEAAPDEAKNQPGVVAVVIKDGFAGVVAERRSQAYAALAHLELTWTGGTILSQTELEELVTVNDDKGVLVQRVGNLAQGLVTGQRIEASYRTPLAAHAHLEPQAALADVSDKEATIYVSTQAPNQVQERVAALLGFEASQVRVVPLYLGGGFGRKMGHDCSTEAARLAAAVGRPVHVGWNRTEDMRHGYLRPPAHNVLLATVNDDGRIQALEQRIASGDIIYGQGNIPFEPIIAAIMGTDPLALTTIFYDIPNLQLLYHRRPIPVPTGSWRGLGALPNVFAVESFMDEIAQAVGLDPIQLRLVHLPDGELGQRMEAALKWVADASGWGSRPKADGHGLGVGLGLYGNTVVALVAEASMSEAGVEVHEIWCAADPGLVVNPDGAEAQAQGSIIMALSSVLHEKLIVEDGMVVASNFDRYPLITQRQTPRIHVNMISSSDTPLGGMGEPVIGVVPAAVANAIYAATGQRLRELPLRG